ncbi:MAG: bifunctional phosphopantothenoylcysteine decarboxylase/phosphopantothenate--cysteine ligase CoaBC [Candidatus Hydrogenedentes bacterium]|nr:bifunctional phosphopantothenoylcysteine decarboxylase/phosphopantothenate--cysteine ligase CoaBC [Candidatus Hydrogenedentota bacterium]
MSTPFSDKHIVLGVTGSIAAYKACELASRLVESGAKVTAVLTKSAQQFVGPVTFEAITGRRAICDLFERGQEAEIEHITVARNADLFLIAPASANVLAKAAHGLADDWLSTALLATRAPILFAPAMNMQMYAHSATQANVAVLRERGCHFVGPESGRLACGDFGPGRLIETGSILEAAAALISTDRSLAGKQVLITSGPTREPIDPVRYVGNRSSGKMGRALAQEALRRGASVTVVSGPASAPLPAGATVVKVETAEEMLEAVRETFAACDVFIAAAAVADYRPEQVYIEKHKRDVRGMDVHLVPNPDIAAEMGLRKTPGQVLVGFAAETEHLLEQARQKLEKKGLDLIVANSVAPADTAIGAEDAQAALLDAQGHVEDIGRVSKETLARRLFDRIAQALPKTSDLPVRP